MLLANIEYIFLRLLRRFVFSDKFLLKYGRYLPYYKVNANQINPTPIIISYQNYLKDAGINPENLNSILEIGVGATNSTGYEMAAQGFAPQGQITMLEPFTNYDKDLDNKIFTGCGYAAELRDSVRRIRKLSDLETDSVDLVLSNSVLEHVDDFSGLIIELCRVLRPGGVMLHIVDYRDHFFKYPYHFLQFSNAVWNRYLNPGDLPRWRLNDHIEIIRNLNLKVEVLFSDVDDAAFMKIKPSVHPMFDIKDEQLAVTHAVLLVKT